MAGLPKQILIEKENVENLGQSQESYRKTENIFC